MTQFKSKPYLSPTHILLFGNSWGALSGRLHLHLAQCEECRSSAKSLDVIGTVGAELKGIILRGASSCVNLHCA